MVEGTLLGNDELACQQVCVQNNFLMEVILLVTWFAPPRAPPNEGPMNTLDGDEEWIWRNGYGRGGPSVHTHTLIYYITLYIYIYIYIVKYKSHEPTQAHTHIASWKWNTFA